MKLTSKQTQYKISIAVSMLLILINSAYLLFKLGQKSVYEEKWKDYDDYGWS